MIAAGGLVLLQVTSNAIFDGLASILIGLLLVGVAIMLSKETRNLLLGATAPWPTREVIRTAILDVPEVYAIARLLTMRLGLDSILLTGEINVADDLSTDEIKRLLQHVTRRIQGSKTSTWNLTPHPNPSGLSQQPHGIPRRICQGCLHVTGTRNRDHGPQSPGPR